MTALDATTPRTTPGPAADKVAGVRRPPRRPARRRRRPGWLVYALLIAFLIGSAFPLYW